MRLGIDVSCWVNRRGFGRFTRALVPAVIAEGTAHDWVLVADADSARSADLPADAELCTVPLDEAPATAASAQGSRRLRDMARMSRAARRARCDAFFFPATYSYVPVVGVPTVVVVHDATAERRPALILADRKARAFWALKQQVAVRRASAVVTVSEAARDEILDALPVRADRLHVIREAPDPVFAPRSASAGAPVLERFGVHPGQPYLVYVGGISPHKNVGLLVDAFAEVARAHPDARLLVVGDDRDDPFLSSAASVRQRIEDSPAHGRITLTGFVPDNDLVALYGGAVATVLPSLGEGFGLTAAESAACGTPVVAAAVGGLRTIVAHGGTGFLVDGRDPAVFAHYTEEILDSPRLAGELSTAAAHRAGGYTWSTTAGRLRRLHTDLKARSLVQCG